MRRAAIATIVGTIATLVGTAISGGSLILSIQQSPPKHPGSSIEASTLGDSKPGPVIVAVNIAGVSQASMPGQPYPVLIETPWPVELATDHKSVNASMQTKSPTVPLTVPRGWEATAAWVAWHTQLLLTETTQQARSSGLIIFPAATSHQDGMSIAGKLTVSLARDERLASVAFCYSTIRYEVRDSAGNIVAMDRLGGDLTKEASFYPEEACKASVNRLVEPLVRQLTQHASSWNGGVP